jgi:hypothetical protein
VTSAPHHKKLRMVPYFPTRLQLPANSKVLSASVQTHSVPLWKSDPGGDGSVDTKKKSLSVSHGDKPESKGVRIAPLPIHLTYLPAQSEDSSTKQDSSSTSSPSHTPKSPDSDRVNPRSNSMSKIESSAVISDQLADSETGESLAGSSYLFSQSRHLFISLISTLGIFQLRD